MNVQTLIDDLARADHTTQEGVVRDALAALLRERRRAVRNDQLDIFRRYGVVSADALEEGIRSGALPECPAWEDRVALDTLGEALERIDRDLAAL